MKSIFVVMTLSTLLVAAAARADTLDLAKLKCSDFAAGSSKDNTTVATWLNGYYMGENDEAIIDFDKLNNLGNALVKFCAANPDMSVSDAAERLMGKKGK